MSNEIILNADARLRTGTNKNREIRREDSMVPAVIYGNNEDTKNHLGNLRGSTRGRHYGRLSSTGTAP